MNASAASLMRSNGAWRRRNSRAASAMGGRTALIGDGSVRLRAAQDENPRAQAGVSRCRTLRRRQCAAGFASRRPVFCRTYSSSHMSSERLSRYSSEPRITARKPSGIEMRPGLRRSNAGFSRPTIDVRSLPISLILASAAPFAFSDLAIAALSLSCAGASVAAARSALAFARFAGLGGDDLLLRRLDRERVGQVRRDQHQPDGRQRADDHAEHDAAGVAALPEQRQQHAREVGRRRDRERQRHQVGDVLPLGQDADRDRHRADDDRGDARRPHLLLRRHVVLADHADVEVVRHRRGRGEHQPRHHRDDRGEGHRGDERQEEVAEHRVGAAAEVLREQRAGHVAAGVDRT